MAKEAKKDPQELTVEQKLKALFTKDACDMTRANKTINVRIIF